MSVGIGFSKFGHRLVVLEYFVPQILLFENRKNDVYIQRTVFFERKLEGIAFLQKLCNFLASKGEKVFLCMEQLRAIRHITMFIFFRNYNGFTKIYEIGLSRKQLKIRQR